MAPDELPTSPPVRASDAEREAAADRLKQAAGDGRLTLEELAERSEAAYAAVTRADVDQLLADLPAPGTGVAPSAPSAPAAPAKPTRRTFGGIMGGDPILEEGELTLRVYSLMGGADIHVPHGVHVERTGFSLMGGDSIEAAKEPPSPGAPVIHLHSINVMGGNDVKRGPGKPSRWSWHL